MPSLPMQGLQDLPSYQHTFSPWLIQLQTPWPPFGSFCLQELLHFPPLPPAVSVLPTSVHGFSLLPFWPSSPIPPMGDLT